MTFKIGDIVKSSANEVTSYKIVDLIVWNDTQILKVKPTDKHLSDLSFVVINDKYHATYTLISSSEKVGVDGSKTGTSQDSAPISEKPMKYNQWRGVCKCGINLTSNDAPFYDKCPYCRQQIPYQVNL